MKKINVICLLKIICVVILFLFAVSFYIGRKYIKYIKYDEFANNAWYFSEPVDSVYGAFSRVKSVLINDDDVDEIEELFSFSDYVLEIISSSDQLLLGKGVINQANVVKIYKCSNDCDINIGDSIKIYDLVSSWGMSYINYYGGMTPLKKGDHYIVFIKKSPRPNLENVYMFSSVKYGHFNISQETNILFDYENGSKTFKEISKYDYVYLKCDGAYNTCETYDNNYEKLKKELLKMIEE